MKLGECNFSIMKPPMVNLHLNEDVAVTEFSTR